MHAQSCLTFCDSTDCGPPGFSVHGIFLARIVEWVVFSCFRGSFQPRVQTCISCVSCFGGQILYHWALLLHIAKHTYIFVIPKSIMSVPSLILFSLFRVAKPPERAFFTERRGEVGGVLDIGQTRDHGVWCMSRWWVCRMIQQCLTLPVTQFCQRLAARELTRARTTYFVVIPSEWEKNSPWET